MFVRNEVMTVSLLGQLLPELQDKQIQEYYGRSPRGSFRKLLNFIRMIKASMKSMSVMKEWEQKLETFEIGSTAKTSEELYQCINQNLNIWEKSWLGSVLVSSRSGNMTTALISIIGGDANKWTLEHYGDIALLLSNCTDVYSAEVPRAMESIAKDIAEKGEEFIKLFLDTNDEDCLQLIEKYPELKKSVAIFLSRHGHRCLRESELREKSWLSAPEKFISVLKIVLKNKSYEKSQRNEVSVSELLGKMKTKIPFHKKLITKLLLPKAWKSVGDREWAKSLAVKMNDIFKLAYFRLATLLFQEGRLPDPDLVYFFTHQEISKLLYAPSAHLIIKAQKRRKILNKQMAKKFEKISKSQPKPIDLTTAPENVTDVEVLKGMPVSQGQVIGPAQVVHTLEEASVIKPGDILVVSSTDVGWSPYFPLIAGLITELGGLISHGAVVAREYGIPCVVNVPFATSLIRTGEMLQIDGRLGSIKRLDIKTAKSNGETKNS
ncbi:hypothetical protein Btru_011903 [Bulinus truncatus]|nr:hypothetical protein Btru_011903 [Bulinus truncatus]